MPDFAGTDVPLWVYSIELTRLALIFLTIFTLSESLAQTDSLGNSFLKENQTAKVRQQLSKTKQVFTLQKPTVNFKLSKDTIDRNDSLKTAAKSKIDSVKTIGNAVISKPAQIQGSVQDKVNQPVNFVNNKIQSAEQAVNKPIDSLNQKVANLESKLDRPIDNLETKANTAVQKVAGESGIEVDKIDIPKLDEKVPLNTDLKLSSDVKLDGIKTNDLIKTDVPNVGGIQQNDKVQELVEKKADLQGLPGEKVKELKAFDKVENISGKVDELDGKLAKVEGLENDAKKLASGKTDQLEQLPDEVENRFGQLEETKVLSEKTKQMNEYQDMIQKYKDKKLVQQELRTKMMSVANDELGENAALVKKAQDSYAKGKRVTGNFQNMKEIRRLPANLMKGKPLKTRFVPGLTLQTYQSNKLLIDIAPHIGFRISGRVTTGVSGVYRISVNKHNKYFLAGEEIYGGRFYTTVTIAKGFFAHGDFEYLRTNQRDAALPDQWQNHVAASHFGIGKSYSISRQLKGSAVALYRLEYAGHLQGPKFLIRVGFDWQLGKKKKGLKRSDLLKTK